MYDYIIVGGGSAGCALANRLSENPDCQVLLLEAGKTDKKSEIHVPAAFSKLFKTEYDWNYKTPVQPNAGYRELYLPRGKVMGGCSSINAMIYIRGNKADFDHWEAEGNEGWGYDSLLPYFKKSESNGRLSDEYHGTDGELKVNDLQDPFPLSKAFVEAGSELGHEANPDFNGAQQEGFGLYQVNQQKGKRWSSAKAFISNIQAQRPNLTVLTESPANRIVLENGRAVGVEVQLASHIQEYRASEGVIISAGAYNSPQLLMCSGIGPAAHLREFGIKVQVDLPGVGKNLQDHLIVPMVFHTRNKHTLEQAEGWRSILNYLVWAEGPLSSNIAEAGAFIHTRPGMEGPDIQFHFAPGFFMNHGFDRPTQGHGFSMGPTLLQPESVGEVRLSSASPHKAPIIDHQYLEDQLDVETLVAGMQVGYQLLRTKALGRFFKDYYFPQRKLTSKKDLMHHVRNTAQTLYHPTGTCKMGRDPMAVVDATLNVHGVEGLYVADASIMPQIVRGNTNAATVAIAEKAAEMLLNPKENAFPQDRKALEQETGR